jgi:hypothetical protein
VIYQGFEKTFKIKMIKVHHEFAPPRPNRAPKSFKMHHCNFSRPNRVEKRSFAPLKMNINIISSKPCVRINPIYQGFEKVFKINIMKMHHEFVPLRPNRVLEVYHSSSLLRPNRVVKKFN